ncbi:IDEAL domain-containing protein [Pseudogracilibacillus sp. ICA-222130]|uniref:IDEAL domain-containing protein n=1 Tax=Pseudogracilibacillus sp. ICA-222130 TaxID=3134655 RepID=UPI0030BD091E
MVTVKLLKPYYIKMNSEYIRVILAYQYFSLIINKKVYHFIPIEGQEILVNRKTKQVVNTETKFAFQNGKDIVYLTMKKLTTLEDFMNQLDDIIKPYYDKKMEKQKKYEEKIDDQTSSIIKQLEKQNIIRLIDKALDEKDEKMFQYLTKLL